MIIFHYGTHISYGVPYLVQTGKTVDAVGLGLDSPFTLELPSELRPMRCPHAIDLGMQAPEMQLSDEFLNNPLVDLYLPKVKIDEPQGKVAFIKFKGMESFPVLKRLSELTSSDAGSTRIYSGDEARIARELRITNLCPLSLVGVSVPSSMSIYPVVERALVSPRNLIIAGHPDIPVPPGAIDMTDAYNVLPAMLEQMKGWNFAALGAQFFKSYARMWYEQHGNPTAAPA